jgi:hypothetical protein
LSRLAQPRRRHAGSQPRRPIYVTFLASTFRSIRCGLNEAHGRGVAIQLNKFLDAGAVIVNGDGTFGIRPEAMKRTVTDLTASS